MICRLSTFGEIATRWLSLDFSDDESTLVQVMAWCRQAPSHYLSHCWPRSVSPYGIIRPQWVNVWCTRHCFHFFSSYMLLYFFFRMQLMYYISGWTMHPSLPLGNKLPRLVETCYHGIYQLHQFVKHKDITRVLIIINVGALITITYNQLMLSKICYGINKIWLFCICMCGEIYMGGF